MTAPVLARWRSLRRAEYRGSRRSPHAGIPRELSRKIFWFRKIFRVMAGKTFRDRKIFLKIALRLRYAGHRWRLLPEVH
jgi:hypothetical protein